MERAAQARQDGVLGPPGVDMLIEKALQVLDGAPIRVLMMNREFGGKRWLCWLERRGLDYVVRVKLDYRIRPHQSDWLGWWGRWWRYCREHFAVCGQ
jgi:hypothetical protein